MEKQHVINIDTTIKHMAYKKNIEICNLARSESIEMYADRLRMTQIMYNLLSNAIKFTPEKGNITINAWAMDKKLYANVEDTGIGISGDNISKTFLPFFTTKDVGEGTGLGLSVVYGIIQNHNGDIKVSSEPGNGTIFQICLPLEDN